MGHRTPQLGTYTYDKIHALCKIFALHKIFVLGNFSFFSFFFCFCFFRFFFFRFFFLGGAKIAWNHVFWNMGKVAIFRETSVVTHTIAFQVILAKKKRKKKEKKGKSKGTTHTVLFSHSRKLRHSRGGIVLYRWNYFARKKTGSSMICVPRSCCAGLFAEPQRCQERWGWRC